MSSDSTASLPDAVQLRGALRPFSSRRTDCLAPAGVTIAQALEAAGWGFLLRAPNVRIQLDDRLVPREQWDAVRPRAGQTVYVRVVPGGGGGGKDPMKIVLTLAIVVAAVWVGVTFGPALAGAMDVTSAAGISAVTAGLTATVMAVGTLAINLLSPAQLPSFSMSSGRSSLQGDSGTTYSISGARNSARKYEPVPKVYGKHRTWPAYGANPYTEIIGDDEYLRMLFVVGYGRLRLSEHKIGETDISAFTGVEMVVREGYAGQPGLSLYSNQVAQDVLSIPLTAAGGWQTRTTRENTDEISFDVYFAQMFVVLVQETEPFVSLKLSGKNVEPGDYWETSVSFEAQYRAVGAASWSTWGSFTVTANSRTAIRRGYRLSVPRGQYEVRWRRTTADDATGYVMDTMALVAVRSLTIGAPLAEPQPLCTVELRIKATDQLNGVIDQYNCVAEAYLPVWDGASWTDQITRSPAWAYIDVLRGAANKRAIADARLDADGIKAWADSCAAAAWTFDAVIDSRTTVFELLRQIASVGRAAWSMVDNLYSVVEDTARSTPVQLITPRNSWGYAGQKIFPNPQPHAIRARFINADAGYQQDEITVYDDGYSAANATVFETYDVFGMIDSDQVWRHVRYRIAAARLRPEFHTVTMDIENLIATRGDLVLFQHDVPMIGVGASARIKSLTETGGELLGVLCDDSFPLEAGKSYLVKIRGADGLFSSAYVDATESADTAALTFRLAIPSGPDAGDLVSLYETETEESKMLLVAVVPGQDFTAKLTMIDYHPGVYTADQGDIPAWTSNITRPPNYAAITPPRPAISRLTSDETALYRLPDGTLQSQILAAFSWSPGEWTGHPSFQLQFRLQDGGDWRSLPFLPAEARSGACWPVEDRGVYDVRIRTVGSGGVASEWFTALGHTVVGKSTPPPDVPELLVDGRVLRWAYPDPPMDHAGFLARAHYGDNRNWASATPLHGGVLADTRLELPDLSGTWTVLVKAVDTAGNESDGTAVVVLGLGDRIVSNLIETTDLAALGFPGTVTGGALDSGALKADDTSLFWGDDDAPFWGPPDDLFWDSVYSEMSYVFTYRPTPGLIGETLFIELEAAGGSVQIEYRSDSFSPFWGPDDDLFWGPDDETFWDLPDYAPWPGSITLEDTEYEFRITIPAGQTRGVISALELKVDVPDITEWFEDMDITDAGSGVRLPISKSYRAIKRVLLTLQDDGGDAVTLRVMDKDADLGPLIKALDASGVATTATFDAVIQGY